MEKILCAIILSLLPFTGVQAAINPFKPYMPLNRIDYSHNISLTKDATSIAYRPESFAQTSLLPAGLLATSFLFDDYKLDKSIVQLGTLKSPSLKAADYVQFSPAAVLFALKLSGLEGRSDWPRMITAGIISTVLCVSVNQTTKIAVGRERPDGSTRNSYPSGHTATAFVCAQMLHYEYGQTVSPWISVCGYGLAASTGFCRIISDRHWCSDVLGGAALGIFTTQVAYYLTDCIFGEHGLKRPVVVQDIDETTHWKFGLYSDYSIDADVFTSQGYGNPDTKPACSIGIDATWMPWYIGPTLRAGLTQMKWTGSDDIYLPHMGSVADVYTVGAGFDLDIPIISRITLNGQAIAGYSPKTNSYSFLDSGNQPLEWDIPAGMHCYGNLGMTVRTSAFSSISVHGGLDYYDKVWRSFVLGARFNFTF